MALSFSLVRNTAVGDRRQVVQDITLDTSYPTGGYALTAAQLGCDIELDFVKAAQGVGGLLFQYDYTNSKLKCWLPTGGAGTPTFAAPTFTASGAGTVVPTGATAVTSTAAQPALTITQPTITANGGIGVEVPNGADLHTLVVRVVASGKGTSR